MWEGAHTVVLGTGKSCTIVAIHGYGDRPENFARVFSGMTLDATIVLPRAPTPQGNGWAWFISQRGADPSTYAAAIGAAAERLASGLKQGVPGSKHNDLPIITGFSQGGMLSWTVTATHPEVVRAALPIGGFLPESLTPNAAGTVPIHGFHGDADTVVSYRADADGADRMKRLGWPVTFERYEGVPHTISPSMHRDYAAALARACQ